MNQSIQFKVPAVFKLTNKKYYNTFRTNVKKHLNVPYLPEFYIDKAGTIHKSESQQTMDNKTSIYNTK